MANNGYYKQHPCFESILNIGKTQADFCGFSPAGWSVHTVHMVLPTVI